MSHLMSSQHLRKIGIFAILWNAMGCFDYLMVQMRNPEYMNQSGVEYVQFYESMPIWAESAWAIAVWGGVLGGVLLLMRKRLAVPVFLASFIGMVLTTIRNFGMANGMEIMGGAGAVFAALIFVIALWLYLYARKLGEEGVLS